MMTFSFGCKERIDSLQFTHQLLLDEKEALLNEKDVRLQQIQNITQTLSKKLESSEEVRLQQIQNITQTLSKKLESSEDRLFQEWLFTKVIIAMSLVVFLAMVLLMLLLLTGRDKYTRRLETQIAKYEGLIEEKDHRVKELEKELAEASQRKPCMQQQPPTIAPFLYAIPGPPPNTCIKANGDL